MRYDLCNTFLKPCFTSSVSIFYWAEWDFMMLNILSKDKWELNLKYCTSIINPTSKLCCDFPDMSRPGLAFICISVVCGAESWHTISLYLAICPSVCHESQKNEESYKQQGVNESLLSGTTYINFQLKTLIKWRWMLDQKEGEIISYEFLIMVTW